MPRNKMELVAVDLATIARRPHARASAPSANLTQPSGPGKIAQETSDRESPFPPPRYDGFWHETAVRGKGLRERQRKRERGGSEQRTDGRTDVASAADERKGGRAAVSKIRRRIDHVDRSDPIAVLTGRGRATPRRPPLSSFSPQSHSETD